MAATAAIITSVVSAGVSISQSRKAQKAQEKADDVSRAQAQLENQRRIRQAVAATRIQQARLLSASEGQGAGDSSAVQGGLASSQGQLGANIGFARQTQGANAGINANLADARRFSSNAAIAQQVGALSSQFGFDPKSAAKSLAKTKGTPDGS